MGRKFAALRLAVRSLGRTPAHSLAMVAVLSLGVGANAAVFSAIDQLILRPLPYTDPGRLAKIWEDFSSFGGPRQRVSPATWLDWRRRSRAFEDVAAYRLSRFNLSGGGAPEQALGIAASPDLLSMLGASPLKGRLFAADDDQPGTRVVVISHGLWQRRFGGDPGAIGRTLTMDGETHVVIGVMPAAFQFPDALTDYWVPLALTPELAQRRNSHFLHVIARLAPGRTWADAREEMSAIAAQLSAEHPATNARVGVTVVPLETELLGGADDSVFLLFAAAGCLLLLACANAANLALVRGTVRRRELAIRLALGASRLTLVRDVALEALPIASAAAVVGLAVAQWTSGTLGWLVPPSLAGRTPHVNAVVVLFAAATALTSSFVCALVPVLAIPQASLLPDLVSAGGRVAGGGARLRNALVVFEIGVAVVLVAAAGLFIQTLAALHSVDAGFQSDHVLTASIQVPLPKYADAGKRARFYDEVISKVQAIPGVTSVGLTSDLPYTSRGNTMSVALENRDDLTVGRDALFRLVSSRYLETIGARLIAGRLLTDGDVAGATPAVVVNEAFAREYFPGLDPLGRRIDTGTGVDRQMWMTVVGVVADVRERGADAAQKSAVYVPYAQTTMSFFQPSEIAVRAAGDPLALARDLERAVWSVDPEQPVTAIRTFDDIVDGDLAGRRGVFRLLAAFASVALLLAAIGVYGVLSYVVAQSRAEIGIRMAVGATPAVVIRSVLGYAGRLIAAGVVLGIAASAAVTRVLGSSLFGVSPLDPVTLGTSAALLASVAAAAAYGPARRAASVDPMLALRADQ